MTVAAALERLRAAADEVRAGWLPAQWSRTSGGATRTELMEPRRLQDQPYGVFPALRLEPDAELSLRTRLSLPAEIAGVAVEGEPLELTVNSLYPISVDVDGTRVLDASGVPAASGPALVTLADRGTLTLEIRTPANRVFSIDPRYVPPWIWLHFTTPGLRARFEQLDLAWARLFLADQVATTDDRRDLVAGAAALVPSDALAATADDLDALALALAPLAAEVATMRVGLVGHSHIDLAWLWTWEDAREVAVRDLTTVLALMDEFPEMRFTHSQPPTYEVLRERRPDLFEQLLAHVRTGRWEPATAQWVESDTNLVAGESMARQLLEGVTWTREVLGRSPDVFLAPDTFGHAGTVPQLAAQAGARAYYHHRCIPNGPDGGWPAYWWEGTDGTRILGVTTPSYYGHITAGDAARAAARARASGLPMALQLYGVCDHGGGPTRESLEVLRRLQTLSGLPRLECSTIGAYVDEVLGSSADLPVHRGESSLTFPGCYTSHGDSKSLNRRAEAALTAAGTLAVLSGARDPSLVEAWRTVLFQQFHDILGGSSIADVYDDQARDVNAAMAIVDDLVERALGRLAAGIDAGSIAVTNPHGWERVDVVSVDGVHADGPAVRARGSHGHVTPVQRTTDGRLCFVARVPAFATVAYTIEPQDGVAAEVDPFTASDLVVELVEEAPVGMSAWQLGATTSEQELTPESIDVLEAGPVCSVVRLRYRVRSSSATLLVSRYAGIERIDVAVDLDWRERGTAETGIPGLKVGVRPAVPATEAWFEAPYGAANRPLDGREVPGLGWGALTAGDDGVALISDTRHAYDARPDRLRLRLVRSPYEPDPEADLGHHDLQLSIVRLVADEHGAQLARHTAARLTPLLSRIAGDSAEAGPRPAGWTPKVESEPNVIVASLAPARSHADAVMVRAYESCGQLGSVTIGAIPGGSRVERATIVEDAIDARSVGPDGCAHFDVGPFEVLTVLVHPERTR